MTHDEQLLRLLGAIEEELRRGRDFEAKQIALWAGPSVVPSDRRKAASMYIHTAIDAEIRNYGGTA